MCRVNDAKHVSYFGSSELGSGSPWLQAMYDCAWPHAGVGFDQSVAQQQPWSPREMPVPVAGEGGPG